MNRFVWCDENLRPDEVVLRKQPGVALYDGDRKSPFVGGELVLSSHQVYWIGSSEKQRLGLHLSLVIFIEEQSATWSKSPKIVAHLSAPSEDKHVGAVQSSPFNYVRFSFRSGGASEFYQEMQKALQKKDWLKMPTVDSRGKKIRTGIVGIERQIQAKHDEADKNISAAFEDLSKLMDMAKEMVFLSKSISQKLKEKGSSLTDDETITFKSHLLSLGISDPVTKSMYGSGSTYHKELAKQLAQVLEQHVQTRVMVDQWGKKPKLKTVELPSEVSYTSLAEQLEPWYSLVLTVEDNIQRDAGGILALTDVYCRVNRARGLELLSPEDLLNACKMMEAMDLPLRMQVFPSGVTVLRLATQSDEKLAAETRQLLDEHGSLSAEDLSPLIEIPVILAKERLLSAEGEGLACRDDSVEGLRFYPNFFLERCN